VVVVHGGFGLTTTFGELLPALAERRQVVAIELRGHGHTRDIERHFSFESFGDEIAGVIEQLGARQADLLGYSLGGLASLRCAISHPESVRRLVLLSIPCRHDGWFPEIRAGFDQLSSAGLAEMRQSPMYQAWLSVAPDPAAFPSLMDKTGELLRRPFDWSDEVTRLGAPTMLVYGDADSIAPSHAAEFFALLGGGLRDAGWEGSLPTTSRLAILPGRTHYDILDASPLAGVIGDFLT
jgi:pimeloyl-ACP methyl ester carboxylesterase